MWQSFPSFGTTTLLGVMVAASYTFAVSLVAGANRKESTLRAARLGAYGTVALIAVAVMTLAYAFLSHDFRLRYVAHYSDRSMPLAYLLTALWGGQDGSLLWWLFLLSLYILACVRALDGKHKELQPYILATLMGVVLFFGVLMAFAANPFSTSVTTRPDGEGLNPLLMNFYMAIHPPSLYTGFVGCTIPFAFAIAALVSGRLDATWIKACRKFTLFALLFLAIGNTLGMLWAYEELGWGGYWAWDPVENAAFMPLLTIAAFVHSVMIQERRGMLKVWNVFLICLTFFMTIFGTFLTRSGAIASVHAFAQSGIGVYFSWFMAVLAAFCATLIMYRWPELRDLPPSMQLRKAAIASGWVVILAAAPGLWVLSGRAGDIGPGGRVAVFSLTLGVAVYAAIEVVFRRMTRGLSLETRRPQIESLLSREFTFVLNNWGLLAFLFFVLVATTFPMVSEALWNEKVTVGPPYYNAWVQPIGLLIFFLMGAGTLFGWKKTSPDALKRAWRIPGAALVGAAALHFAIGARIGAPAILWSEPLYGGVLGQALRAFNAVTPVLGMSLVAFNTAVIVQEFVWLYRARFRSGAEKTPRILFYLGFFPGFVASLFSLSESSRRRYGGYLVHLGIVLMFFGFTGKSWNLDKETTVMPGQVVEVDRLRLEYLGPRMEVDNAKRMIFADVRVTQGGKELGVISPAKFIYKKSPNSPTTEVAMLHSWRDDLYLVVGTINPQTKSASLQIHLNPLVGWIWFGGLMIIFGSMVCMWPDVVPEESRVWQVVRGAAQAAASATLAVLLAILPLPAHAQQPPPPESHHVVSPNAAVEEGIFQNPGEEKLFKSLACMCGTCPKEPLSSCRCDEARATRAQLRSELKAGRSVDELITAYVKQFGSEARSLPADTGSLRTIYVVPIVVSVGAAVGLVAMLRRWRAAGGKDAPAPATPPSDDYDARIDEELRDLDG